MSLRDAVVRQFGRPSGLIGQLVGYVLATRPSNRERNHRTLELLEIKPEDWVLEIGYGPGLGIQWAAEQAFRGKVVGVDHSKEMHRQAVRRNAQSIEEGRVELHLASVNALPLFDHLFDKVFAINTHFFWLDPVTRLANLAAVMKPGAKIALTFQPRNKGASSQDTRKAARQISDDLTAAGFSEVRLEYLPMKPVEAVCVLGRRPLEAMRTQGTRCSKSSEPA